MSRKKAVVVGRHDLLIARSLDTSGCGNGLCSGECATLQVGILVGFVLHVASRGKRNLMLDVLSTYCKEGPKKVESLMKVQQTKFIGPNMMVSCPRPWFGVVRFGREFFMRGNYNIQNHSFIPNLLHLIPFNT